jgi:Tol biopolymer transport system component
MSLFSLSTAVLLAGSAGASPRVAAVSPATEANCVSPRLSPDGARLSWERNDHRSRTVELWTVETQGGTARLAAPVRSASAAPAGFSSTTRTHAAHGAVWAPLTASARLRKRFAFAQSEDGDDYDLHLLDAEGPLLRSPGAEGDIAWSPGAPQRLVYTSARTGGGDLYVLPIGGEPRRLTAMEDSAELAPTLSPDGKSVVFVAHTERGDNLWQIADIDQPQPAPLTVGAGSQGRPQWSPDGRFIAFYALGQGDSDRTDLVVSTPAGQTRTVAEGVVADASGPSWSPDSTRLVFVLDRDDALDPVVAAAPEGGPVRPLELGTVGNLDLSVAPDPTGLGVLVAVAAQGLEGDDQRDFRRIYLARLPALP